MTGTLAITGTGTEIGKTHVTAALARQLRARGATVTASKPVSSGCTADEHGRLWSPDGLELAAAAGADPADWDRHQRWFPERFAAPLSPHQAADRAGRLLSVDLLAEYGRELARGDADWVLAEGVGGVMVPLSDGTTVLDWLAIQGWPVLVVAGTYLGTLSHTLTALRCLAGAGVPLAGVVLNRHGWDEPVPPTETARTLRAFHADLPMAILPDTDAGEADSGETDPDLVAALGLA